MLWKGLGLGLVVVGLIMITIWKKGYSARKQQTPAPLDITSLKELLPHQEPRILGPKLVELWPALDEEARQALRTATREYGWEAYFLTDLGTPNQEKNLKAIEILGLVGGEQSLWPLLGVLASKHETLCFSAAAALKQLQAPGLIEALIDCLASPQRWPPARIAEVILARGQEAVLPLLDKLPLAPFPSPGYIIELLGELGDERGAPYLVAALEDEEPMIRARAVRALARLDTPLSNVAGSLLKALEDQAWEVRAGAALAVGTLGIKVGVPGLEKLLADPDWRVKANVEKALKQLAAVDYQGEHIPR